MIYKRCITCSKLFNSKRADGGVYGIKQFSLFKHCPSHRGKQTCYMEVRCSRGICFIQTSSGNKFYFDEKFVNEVSKYRWYEDSNGYATAHKNKLFIRLHNIIVKNNRSNCRKLEIDHIDRNKKNNLSKNLRLVPHRVNMQNWITKKKTIRPFRGVQRHHNKWRSEITHNGKVLRLGHFKNWELARDARIQKEISLYGRTKDAV